MRITLLSLLCLSTMLATSQMRFDGSFPFDTDPAKNYSVYVPSGYDSSTPHRLMVGFHPFNTNRWDAVSWCDTLVAFAEFNNLILVCPDGGVDGKVDDPIDTAFTTALLDSMHSWYNIDERKVYAMGFSWGGKTTYSYGLSNPNRIKGCMPIGAAINGNDGLDEILQNGTSKPFYLVHGEADSPASRFFPIRASLIGYSAFVEDTLMPGVGHTIDFPNRNAILSRAYTWIDSVNSANILSGILNPVQSEPITVYPNPATSDIHFDLPGPGKYEVRIFSSSGELVLQTHNQDHISIDLLPAGNYFLHIMQGEKLYAQRFIRH